jgi:hypothetical protein
MEDRIISLDQSYANLVLLAERKEFIQEGVKKPLGTYLLRRETV